MLCKGLQGTGIDNVAFVQIFLQRDNSLLIRGSIMSEEQRNLIQLAKTSAHRHLANIISDPQVYLGTFRYGMDFVWGKASFVSLFHQHRPC